LLNKEDGTKYIDDFKKKVFKFKKKFQSELSKETKKFTESKTQNKKTTQDSSYNITQRFSAAKKRRVMCKK